MPHAESDDDLLEDIALSLAAETLETGDSVILNFEFASRRYISQPALFLHHILERFMPHQLVLSGRQELISAYAGEHSIDGVATRIVAAHTPRGIEAYRILLFDEDDSAPFTIQYTTPVLNHGRALVSRFRSIDPVVGSLIGVSYDVFPHAKQLTMKDLTEHFDQHPADCLQMPGSEEIVDALAKKGWLLYPVHEQRGISYILAEPGPVSSIRLGNSYAVVPVADNPRDKDWIDAAKDHAELTSQYLSNPHSRHPHRAIVMLHGGVYGICLVDEQGCHQFIDHRVDFSAFIRIHFRPYDPVRRPDVERVH